MASMGFALSRYTQREGGCPFCCSFMCRLTPFSVLVFVSMSGLLPWLAWPHHNGLPSASWRSRCSGRPSTPILSSPAPPSPVQRTLRPSHSLGGCLDPEVQKAALARLIDFGWLAFLPRSLPVPTTPAPVPAAPPVDGIAPSPLDLRRARKRRVANAKVQCRHDGCSKMLNLSSRSKHEKRRGKHKGCPPDCDKCLSLFFGTSAAPAPPALPIQVSLDVPVPMPLALHVAPLEHAM